MYYPHYFGQAVMMRDLSKLGIHLAGGYSTAKVEGFDPEWNWPAKKTCSPIAGWNL